ncbi:Zinc finger, GATA-type [Corchorus olitorius]|uniref:Zinc finger, GATA-type n=1 Tax=Corchorus olitorius TaxID=93759 RepID=A0A1R3JA00_9ROSI|nr:Zinc finger, GATA-type [Corchorus olitorius]
MTSSNCYSSVYPFPIDLNQDHDHQNQLFNLNPQPSISSSSSCPLFFNPPTVPHDQPGYFSSTRDQPQQDQAKIHVPQTEHDEPLDESDVSTGLKFSIWKKEEQVLQQDEEEVRNETAAKWMSSKMRIMRKMMSSSSDHHGDNNSSNSSTRPKFEDQKQQQHQLPSSSSPDNSCSNSSYNNNNNTIRVCADCNTTKTPLWRSGPRGPKSLCNACGIRQRKARRAMAAAAAAAAANGSINVAAESTKPSSIKSKVQHKAKRSSNNGLKNKKCKLSSSQSHQGRKKLCFEDLRVILSKNSAFHRVFPQDEKEAAILLMALSYGLVHG